MRLHTTYRPARRPLTLTQRTKTMSKQRKDIPIQLARRKPNVVTCPVCGRKSKFSLYIYTATNEPIDPDHRSGLCNVCGYHYPPREYFKDHGRTTQKFASISSSSSRQWIEPFDTVNPKKVEASHRHDGTLYHYLANIFDKEAVDKAWDRYLMGITKDDRTIFWQVDNMGEVRTGEFIKYLSNGHRDHATAERWAHNIYKDFSLSQCLFGLHLVENDQSPVFVVEAPKNALICSICYPQYIWVAVGSRDQFNGAKLWWVKSHPIVAVPDVDAIQQWTAKAGVLRHSQYNVQVYDFRKLYKCTEDEVKEIGEKGDIADLLIMRSRPPYHIPQLPLLQAMIARQPAIATLCEKLELEVVGA